MCEIAERFRDLRIACKKWFRPERDHVSSACTTTAHISRFKSPPSPLLVHPCVPVPVPRALSCSRVTCVMSPRERACRAAHAPSPSARLACAARVEKTRLAPATAGADGPASRRPADQHATSGRGGFG